MTDQTPKPDYAEADRWAANAHEGIDRTDWLHAQAYLVLRAEVERLRDVVIAGSCISRLDQVYQVCVCGAGEPCREAIAILASRQKEEK